MGDLMAHYGPDCSVVGGGRRLGIEEGRLQDGGREVQRLIQREIDAPGQIVAVVRTAPVRLTARLTAKAAAGRGLRITEAYARRFRKG